MSAGAGPAPVRIVLCTNGGLAGAMVLARLAASPRVEIAGVVVSTRYRVAGQGPLAGAADFVRRCGLRYAMYLWCATTLAARLTRRPPSVARQLGALAVSHHGTDDIDSPGALAYLRGCTPDLIVSAFFNQRIGEPALAVAKLGGVNIHPSLLPDFRGVDPVFHALLRGHRTLGVSVHHLTPVFDAGNILATSTLHAVRGDSVMRATALLYRMGAGLLLEALPRIVAGDPGAPQSVGGNYDSWPSPADVAAFRREGHALVRLGDLTDLLAGRPLDGDDAHG